MTQRSPPGSVRKAVRWFAMPTRSPTCRSAPSGSTKRYSHDRSSHRRLLRPPHRKLPERLHLQTSTRPFGNHAALALHFLRTDGHLVRQHSGIQLPAAPRTMPLLQGRNPLAVSVGGTHHRRTLLLVRIFAWMEPGGAETLR